MKKDGTPPTEPVEETAPASDPSGKTESEPKPKKARGRSSKAGRAPTKGQRSAPAPKRKRAAGEPKPAGRKRAAALAKQPAVAETQPAPEPASAVDSPPIPAVEVDEGPVGPAGLPRVPRTDSKTGRQESEDEPEGRPISADEIVLEFEQRPMLEMPIEVEPLSAPGPAGPPRRLAFVLHAHLPWVLGHGTWPHGEDWLAEAVVHCYLPLLDAFRRLAGRGRRRFVTVSVTPVLGAMLGDPRTEAIVDRYLAERSAAAWEARRRHPLALWWNEEYERLRGIWQSFDKNLVRGLADLAELGAVELSTSAGTHVYLPLTHTPKLARLALRVGRESHRERFGEDPRGCWMPECAYRPGGPWRHPVTGASEESRPGNEELLAEQGLQWTVLDAHLLRHGDPAFPYLSDLPPDEVVEPGGPHPQPFWIRRSSVAAFVRDARTAAQVWSRQGGYPGDAAFLDFHKRHWPSGLRLWRVTGRETELQDKLVYWPQDASERAREQAEHFVEMVAGLEGMGGGVVGAPFDAELFGHWWFEGPVWLERVLELCAPRSAVEATTPARELDAGPSLRRAFFAEGSWGARGDHSVWVNPRTEWFWHELAEAERSAFAATRWGGSRAWRRAVLNQLLLAAASDWPFLVTMETGQDYAERRFREHMGRLRELIELGPRARHLPDWVPGDLPFPDLEPEWARAPEE